jgi:DNA polymerase-3 subunit beta
MMPLVETEVEKPAVQGAAMDITVSRQELVKELTATQSVVERKTTIPILSNFLVEAEGERLTITATDLDQAIRTSASVKVKKPGSCTIPARKLYDYIKLLPDGDISIKMLENHWVQIRSGRSNTKMVGMARANYPQVPEFPVVTATSIPAIALRTLIARTIFAISNEESRYTLNGALLVLKAESLAMVATDGHRLSFVEKPGELMEGISGEKRVLIPRRARDGFRGSSQITKRSCRGTTPSLRWCGRASCRRRFSVWHSLPMSGRARSGCGSSRTN